MAQGKCATSLSNYTSVPAAVNEGEQRIGIALMGKVLMRIRRTPKCSQLWIFQRPSHSESNMTHVRQCERKMLSGFGRCACMPSTKFSDKQVAEWDKQQVFRIAVNTEEQKSVSCSSFYCNVKPPSVFHITLPHFYYHTQNMPSSTILLTVLSSSHVCNSWSILRCAIRYKSQSLLIITLKINCVFLKK